MVRYNYEEQRQYAVLLKPRTDKEMYFNKRQNKKYCF